jgi:hypothetical protein
MFKIFHLDISKFSFLLFCSFRTKNYNRMSILPLTPKLKLHHFENDAILESMIKFVFSVQNGKMRENQSLINTPK